eukprot:764684-Hanusia_phi.AAC.2
MLRSKVASSEGASGTQGSGTVTVSLGKADLVTDLTIGGKKSKILVDRDGAMVNMDFARFGQQTYNYPWASSWSSAHQATSAMTRHGDDNNDKADVDGVDNDADGDVDDDDDDKEVEEDHVDDGVDDSITLLPSHLVSFAPISSL